MSNAQRDSFELARTSRLDTIKNKGQEKLKIEKGNKNERVWRLFHEANKTSKFKAWHEKEIEDYSAIKDLPVIDIHIRNEAKRLQENSQISPLPSYPDSEKSPYFYFKYASDKRSTKIPLRLSTKEFAVQFASKLSDNIGSLFEIEGVKIPQISSRNLEEAIKKGELITGLHNFVFVKTDGVQTAESLLAKISRLRNYSDFQQVSEVFYGPDDPEGIDPLIPNNQITVVFRGGTSASQIQALNREYGTEVIREFKGIYKLRVTSGGGILSLQVAEQYRKNPLTVIARPNFHTLGALLEQDQNDPLFGVQWHLDDPQFRKDIDAPDAWKITTGDPSVIIAILDSGIDLAHEDLLNNTQSVQHVDALLSEYNRPLSLQGRYRLEPEHLVDPQGFWGFHTQNNGHGTTVAGVAGAVGKNSLGGVGLAPNVGIKSILTIATLDSAPPPIVLGSKDITAEAIDIARTGGAKVVNISFRNKSSDDDTAFHLAVNDADAANMVVVKSIGNVNQEQEPSPYHEKLIIVGATQRDGQRWTTSTKGSTFHHTIDVVAPGRDIYTTDISVSGLGYDNYSQNDKYTIESGTSLAAPLVSALAAMLFTINPNFTPEFIRTLIRQGARDQVGNSEDEPGFDKYHGYGLINAYNTLLLAKSAVINGNFEVAAIPDQGGGLFGGVNTVSNWSGPFSNITPSSGDGSGNGARAGFQSLKLEPTGQATVDEPGNPPIGFATAASGAYNSGDMVTATAWVKSQPGTRIMFGVIDQSFSDSSGVLVPYEQLDDPEGNGWRPIELVLKVAGGNTIVLLGAIGGTAYFDMVTLREGYATQDHILAGGFEKGAEKMVLGWQRDAGSPWAQDNTFGMNTGNQVGLEGSHCMGSHTPETGTGNIMTYPFEVNKPYINFKVCGHNGSTNMGTENRVEFQTKSGGTWITRLTTYPPGEDALKQKFWDVSQWQGEEGRVCVIDNNSGSGWAWIGVDAFELADAPVSGGGGTLANGNFETNDLTGWSANGAGNPWAINNTWPLHNPQYGPQQGLEGSYCAGTFQQEWYTGTMTSQTFTVDKSYLNLRIGGHDGSQNNAGLNKVELRLASDHTILRSSGTPGTNDLIQYTWDLGNLQNQDVYIACVDNHNGGGHAWISVDDFKLENTAATTPSGGTGGGGGGSPLANGNFESGDLTNWAPSGPWAINNTWPLHNPQHGPQQGLEGSYCAGTNQQESDTGTMTSGNFVINQTYLNFKVGGHDGPQNNAGLNKVELRRASDHAVLLSEGTPGTNDLIQKSWNVSNWNNQTVYIACVDNHNGGGHAWISVDDFKLSGSAAKPAIIPMLAAQDENPTFDHFAVHQNIPNPFNPETTISYILPEPAEVSLVIYNMLGQPIRHLVQGSKSAGRYQIVWDSTDDLGRPVSSGIYLYRMVAGDFASTRKMLVLK